MSSYACSSVLEPGGSSRLSGVLDACLSKQQPYATAGMRQGGRTHA